MKSYVKDMTVGKPTGLLLSFMLPMVIGNVFQQLYSMADSMIVGQFVGADALAAVGATGSVNFLFFSLCSGMANGTGIVISQHFGAGNSDYVKKAIANAAYIMLVAGLAMGGLGVLLAKPILIFLNTPDNILADATLYMRIVCAGVLATAAYNCISAILRAVGDSKTPLYFLIMSSILNVGLDIWFVRGLGMGVAGAGGLQMFDVPQILTNGKGGPDRTSTTMIMYLNNHLFSKNYGMAGAVSVVLFLVCAVLCVVVYFSLTKEDDGLTKAQRKQLKQAQKAAKGGK